MPKRDAKDTEIGLRDKLKAITVTVKGTITNDQRLVLQKLIGVIGSNEQDVVGKILTLWLYNEGFLKTKKLKEQSLKNKNETE